MDIGEKIRKYRVDKGYSQEYMALKLQVSQNAVHKLESGAKIPNVIEISKIAEILEISVQKLMDLPSSLEFNNCTNQDNAQMGIIVNHQFPDEVMQLIKQLLENKT